jgi:predicted  nucleic acid-binding Zn-ribbon protein
VRGRATRDNARLSGGGLPSKELESLQHELVSLARRQNDLEDELLAIMQQRETSEIELAGFEKELADIETERGDLERSRNEAFSEIDTTTAKHRAERAELAGDLPADLIALYDKVAVSGGGVGAAALKARRCEGCHLELAGPELIEARAAAPDLVLRCENCRRILIRTPESGL